MTIEVLHTCAFCGETWESGEGRKRCPRCQDGRDLSVFEPGRPTRSRDDVRNMLLKLAQSPRPKLSTHKRASSFGTQQLTDVRYVCSICQETTIYWFSNDFACAHLVRMQLLKFRQAFKYISDNSGLAFRLDERGLCEHCRPYDTAVGQIHLTVEYADGTTHTAYNIDERDVELLYCFFTGEPAYSHPRATGYVKQIPMKKFQPQLRELLGFPQIGLWGLLHCYLRRRPRQGNW